MWSHSQSLQELTKFNAEPETDHDQQLNIEHDMEDVTFNHITPSELRKYEPSRFDNREARRQKEYAVRYVKKELEYWKGMSPQVFTLTLGRRSKGVTCARASPDHHFMAVGTQHGDVIIYDCWMLPWRPVRVIANTNKFDDSVVDIAWSLDSSRIITVNGQGSLQVWAFDGGAVVKSDLRSLEIPNDAQGYQPLQLASLAAMDVDSGDFSFQLGPFTEQEILSENYNPVKAAFFPSLTFFGSQHSITVALENGDVLKCNLEQLVERGGNPGEEVAYQEAPRVLLPNIYDEAHGVNLLGQNIEGELFRQHKHPIIHMGFVDNMSNMVTVDEKGFFNIWKYDYPFLSGFGWYTPHRKYRLDMSKTMYSPASSVAANTIFTDRQQSNKPLEEIARERLRAQNTLDSMQLGDPWHEEELPNQGLKTLVYAPHGAVQESGAMFNIVIRHLGTNQLSTYLTRMYKPVKVNCTRLLAARQSPSGRELVFLLLFPKYPPKDAHMTILMFDLHTLKLRDMRRDIYLSDQDYNELKEEDIVSCDVSRVLGPTGSEYLFVILNGTIRGVSLKTGKLVLKAVSPATEAVSPFQGCGVNENFIPLPENAKVTVLSSRGKIYAAMYAENFAKIHVLQLDDENEYETRRLTWKAYQTWERNVVIPQEVRVDTLEWELEDVQHVAVEMSKLVLECMDKALAFKGVMNYTEEEREAMTIDDKVDLYLNLEEDVFKRGLLSGKPERADSTVAGSILLQ